jgi:hypothetical protein
MYEVIYILYKVIKGKEAVIKEYILTMVRYKLK